MLSEALQRFFTFSLRAVTVDRCCWKAILAKNIFQGICSTLGLSEDEDKALINSVEELDKELFLIALFHVFDLRERTRENKKYGGPLGNLIV